MMIGTWRGWFACAPNTARRGGAGLVLTAVFFSGLATTADAQGTNGKFRRVSVTREEQKQFVDDLSSARMMDSERDRPSRRRTSSQDLDSLLQSLGPRSQENIGERLPAPLMGQDRIQPRGG